MTTFVLTLCAFTSCVLVLVSTTPAHGPSVGDVHNICQANPATHLSDEVLEAARKGESFNRTLVGAHMFCMTTRLGSQNQDGTINRSGVRSAFAREIGDETKLEELTNKCVAVQESSPEETALKLGACIRDNLPSAKQRQNEHDHHHGHH